MAKSKGFWHSLVCFVSGLTLLFFLVQTVNAAPYGTGSFSACKYQEGCPPASSTQTTLPSGLKISVNLVNGQTIPKKGYTIIVTPLNGQGASFKQVDFYINGKLAQTVLPDTTGTASWFWDPSVYEGTNIKIVVTGTDGSTATEEFQVKIAAGDAGAAMTSQTAGTSAKQTTGISALFSNVAKGVERISDSAESIIRKIPKPIAYSFPYILFVLLGLNILLLLVQTRRELKEYRKFRALLGRGQAVANSKKTLVELVSHYFRTPLTILNGGIDMLHREAGTSQYVAGIQTTVQRMQTKIERLLWQAQTLGKMQTATSQGYTLNAAAPWRNPGLFLPLALIAVVVVLFNYLAANAGTLNISQINLTIQTIVFTALAVITYQVFRNRQLGRRDQQVLDQLTHEEASENETRDRLIAGAVDELSADIKSIDGLAAQVASTQAGRYISDGQARFHDLLTKFTVAQSLRGGHSTAEPQTVRINNMLGIAMQNLQAAAAKRSVTIKLSSEVTFPVQNPELVAFVLRSVLDNAVAYSPDGGSVEVSANTAANGTEITITDHGAGLPPEKLQLLFQPFSRAEDTEHFTHQGMGFNLYLDKLIMAYLGGSIELSSRAGNGTTVTLRLPNP